MRRFPAEGAFMERLLQPDAAEATRQLRKAASRPSSADRSARLAAKVRLQSRITAEETLDQFRSGAPESHSFAMIYNLNTQTAQSTDPENIGPERTPLALLSPSQVNSPSRITLENNEKIRPDPDQEKLFNRLSGGGKETWGRTFSATRRHFH